MKKILLTFILFVTGLIFGSVYGNELSYEEEKQIIIDLTNEEENNEISMFTDYIDSSKLSDETRIIAEIDSWFTFRDQEIRTNIANEKSSIIDYINSNYDNLIAQDIIYITDYMNINYPGDNQALEAALLDNQTRLNNDRNAELAPIEADFDNRLSEEINLLNITYDNRLTNEVSDNTSSYSSYKSQGLSDIRENYDLILAQRLQELDDRYAQDILENVTNLSQYYYDESNNKINIDLGSQVSSLDTGSGVFISTNVTNNLSSNVQLVTNVTRLSNGFISTYRSGFSIGGETELFIPIENDGDYQWEVYSENQDGVKSEIIQFGDSGSNADFSFITEELVLNNPINLKQYYIDSDLNRVDLYNYIRLSDVVIGSGMYLEASIDNNTNKQIKFRFNIYKGNKPVFAEILSDQDRSGTGELVTSIETDLFTTGKNSVLFPYQEGDFYWDVIAIADDGEKSNLVTFNGASNYADFSMYKHIVDLNEPTNLKIYTIVDEVRKNITPVDNVVSSDKELYISADVINNSSETVDLIIEIYDEEGSFVTTLTGSNVSNGTNEIHIPFISGGGFSVTAKLITSEGNSSETVSYSNNDIDFNIIDINEKLDLPSDLVQLYVGPDAGPDHYIEQGGKILVNETSNLLLRGNVNNNLYQYFVLDIFQVGTEHNIQSITVNSPDAAHSIHVPIGKYYWSIKATDDYGRVSDYVHFGSNNINEIDFEVVAFIGPVQDYSDPEEDNNQVNSILNDSSGEFIIPQTDSDTISKETDKQAENKVSDISTEGDPVNLNTGEFVYDNTLMQYSGRGLPFEFKIRYENQAYYNGPIGNNFDYNYNLYLVEGTDRTMNFHNGKLGVFPFTQSGGVFNDNLTIDASLELVDNKYVLSMNNNIFYTFGENNRIESISDLHGNTLSFTYNEDKQLITVTDTLDRIYNFDYFDHSRLKTITDFTGNTVDFSYFGTGSNDGMEYDLDTITTTNSGASRDISFTYTISDEFVDAHNIVKLIDSQDNIYVENIYDENDRVSSQKYGEESIYYNYTLTASGKIIENDVIDRSGNNTIYTYDDFGNTLKKVNKKISGDSVYLYEYNEDNKLSKEILPLGNGYMYSYDERLNLIEKRMKKDVHAADSDKDLVTSYEYHPVFNIKIRVVNPNGLVTDITLYDNGNVISTTTLGVLDYEGNPLDITNSFEYNSFGELIKKTDANGNVTEFEYVNGNLVKTTKIGSTENIETHFSYDNKNNITSITDGEGNITELTYDEFNLLKTQTTPEGIVSQYIYNSLNKKVNESIILADNSFVTTSYEYDILDNPTVITKQRESNRTDTVVTAYDNDSRIIETRSADNAVNTFVYNETGQIIKKVTQSTVGNIVTQYSYDVNNRLLTQTNPNNSIIRFEYNLFDRVIKQTDSQGTYSEFIYDKSGNITSQEVYDVNNVLLQKQENTFDKLNRNIVSNIHNIDTTEILISKSKYDAVGNMIESIDPKGNVASYEYDSFNRVIRAIDSLGNITESVYNKNDKVTSTTLTSTDGKVIATAYVYDKDNRVISETNTLNETMSYTYNNLNQVISKTDKDSGITTYSYDYVGNMLSESHEGKTISYTYDNNSNLQTVTDANNNVTTYNYNDISLLESITYPDRNIMSYSYDTSGNMIEKSDPNGTVINSNYDDINRLISKTITTGSGVLGVTSESYSYDALSRLVSATDSEGNNLEFNFDSLGRLTSETNSNKTINYGYDLVGNRTSITYPGSDIVNYSYDQNNRLESIGDTNGNIASYTYDSLTLLNKTLGNNLETNYGYDELLRLKSLNDFSYTYNTQGNITSNGSDSYNYDNLDRITNADYLNKHNKISAENFEYDLMGNRSFETQTKLNKNGKEKQKKFSYDTNNLNQYLDRSIYVDIEETVEVTGTGEIIPDTTSTGSIEVVDTEVITEEEFLEEEIIEEVIEDEEEIEIEGRLLYDANGNMIGNMLNNKRQYIYSYDYKNRLVKIEKNLDTTLPNPLFTGEGTEPEFITKTKIVEIQYDVLGRRIQKLFNNGGYRNYIYSNQHVILEENYSKKDKLKNSKQFTYSNSLDDVLSMKLIENKTRKIEEEYVNKKGVTKTRKVKEHYVETSTYFYQKDHLGSIIAITDETGTIVEEYAYDIFGKPYSINEEGKITKLKKSPVGNTRMYTGREYDRGLKLYYNRARYYDPKLARFISRDPIDIADDVNLYAYVGNNSVMFVDLMGTEKENIKYTDVTDMFERYILLGDRYNADHLVTKGYYLFDHRPRGMFDIKTNSDFLDLIKINLEKDENYSNYQVSVYDNTYDLSDLGNFFIGLNGYRSGYSLLSIKGFGLTGELVGFDKGLTNGNIDFDYEDEIYDQKYYESGYTVGQMMNGLNWKDMNLSIIVGNNLPAFNN